MIEKCYECGCKGTVIRSITREGIEIGFCYNCAPYRNNYGEKLSKNEKSDWLKACKERGTL